MLREPDVTWVASSTLPTPVRAALTDDPQAILTFATTIIHEGGNVALATLTEVRGGGARSLGSQMAISSDGRYCGYVSGGCVEAAVAAEALAALDEGRDRVVRYGDGSPFFDIVLPCGGGISIAIHILRDANAVKAALATLQQRRPMLLSYSPQLELLKVAEGKPRSGWCGDEFHIAYRPRPRLLISGGSIECEALANLAQAADYDVEVVGPGFDAGIEMTDPMTAVAVLHHDLDGEELILDLALRSPAFYIGALGSTRTHKRREDRLKASGWARADIARIKAPIGFFGPTRDAHSLAISILADISATRLSL